jgi:hypothetical protein
VRHLRNLVLLTAAALAISAMAATSATAIVSPNGDTELDNWKQPTNVKGYRSADGTTGTYEFCPAVSTAPPSGYYACKATVTTPSGSSQFNWNYRSPGTSVTCGAWMKLHFGVFGQTLIYEADWFNSGAFTRCGTWDPASYTTHPALQTSLSGQICKHVPSGTWWLRQGIVLADRGYGFGDEYWAPTFAAIQGNPWYYALNNHYPYGVGLQTDTMSVGTSAQYQKSDGSPENGTGMSQHIPPVKIANVLLTPSATGCPWPGLT